MPDFYGRLSAKLGIKEQVITADDFVRALRKPEYIGIKSNFFTLVNIGLSAGLSFEESILGFPNVPENVNELSPEAERVVDEKIAALKDASVDPNLSSEEQKVIQNMKRDLEDPQKRQELKKEVKKWLSHSGIGVGANIGRDANSIGVGGAAAINAIK